MYFAGEGPTLTYVLDNVDTRGVGGYVVAPGSVDKEGRVYTLVPHAVAQLPKWMSELFGSCRRPDEDQEPAVELDNETSRMAAVNAARSLPPAIEGEGGDGVTYLAACRMRDYGVSETVALEILLAHYNPRCQPPWSDTELAVKVKNAYGYAKGQPGAESPATFSPVTQDVPAGKPTHVGDYAYSEPKPIHWVVEDWIPQQGHTFFSGRGGVGKSTLCLQLAMSVASGKPWFDMPVKQMPVLVIACEDPEDEVHRRVHTISLTSEYAADWKEVPLYVWSRVGQNNLVAIIRDGEGVRPGKFHDELETQLKAMPEGAKLVVLDTIPDVFFGNENDRCSVNAFVKQVLGRWERLYGVTFLCTAHPPKSGAEFSGSTAWEGAFRARLFCEFADPEKVDDFRVLRVGKSNYGRSGAQVTLRRHEDGLFRPCLESDAAEDTKQCIIHFLNDCDSEDNPACWSAGTPRCYYKQHIKGPDGKPLPEASIKRLVQELIQEGRVEIPPGTPRVLRTVANFGGDV